MKVQQNTLYVMTQGAFLRKDHQTVKVVVEKEARLTVPLHTIESVVVFGNVLVSPEMLGVCAEAGVAVTFLTETGRLLARVDAPLSGNVLLRREQFRRADRPEAALEIARTVIAGKLQNARSNLLRAARDGAAEPDAAAMREVAQRIACSIVHAGSATTLDEARGVEGEGARAYFGAFSAMIRADREHFQLRGRNRRPPLDPTNCLLSFVYALLLGDCAAALAGAGLDPNVGFLHVDRPGRPSLALDLMEEFRPLVADRLVLALINRRQVHRTAFVTCDGGAVQLADNARRAVVRAWQERKGEQVTHPLLEEAATIGGLFHLQARILARHIRGDLPAYVPCVLR